MYFDRYRATNGYNVSERIPVYSAERYFDIIVILVIENRQNFL